MKPFRLRTDRHIDPGTFSPLSDPNNNRKRPLRPNRFKKYHDSDDTQRTSISCVSIPRCIMDLNPTVKGNGILTKLRSEGLSIRRARCKLQVTRLTEDESLEEEVDPSHDDHLRHHHHHLLLHPLHHAVHRTWVSQCVERSTRIVRIGVRRSIFKISADYESLLEVR